METETWYVMEDGSVGNPREIVRDAAGLLRHKDGLAVAYAPHGPRSRSVNPAEQDAKAKPKVEPKAEPKVEPKAKAKEIKPEEPKSGYLTRETKAE